MLLRTWCWIKWIPLLTFTLILITCLLDSVLIKPLDREISSRSLLGMKGFKWLVVLQLIQDNLYQNITYSLATDWKMIFTLTGVFTNINLQYMYTTSNYTSLLSLISDLSLDMKCSEGMQCLGSSSCKLLSTLNFEIF